MPEPETVQLLLSVLAIAVQAFVVAVLVVWLVARRQIDRIAGWIGDSAMPVAALIASVAVLGSLYFSESAGYVPCPLCWYQRILMYPLALVLVPAAVRNDMRISGYAIWLACVGAVISAYHYQLEVFPQQTSIACDLDVPCTVRWFTEFGYISLAMLALTAFAGIITLLLLARRRHRTHAMG